MLVSEGRCLDHRPLALGYIAWHEEAERPAAREAVPEQPRCVFVVGGSPGDPGGTLSYCGKPEMAVCMDGVHGSPLLLHNDSLCADHHPFVLPAESDARVPASVAVERALLGLMEAAITQDDEAIQDAFAVLYDRIADEVRPVRGRGYSMTDSCTDCGALVTDWAVHARFHSILDAHGHALAIIQSAHLTALTHDRYDVVERIGERKSDSWSADALAEVIADHESEAAR